MFPTSLSSRLIRTEREVSFLLGDYQRTTKSSVVPGILNEVGSKPSIRESSRSSQSRRLSRIEKLKAETKARLEQLQLERIEYERQSQIDYEKRKRELQLAIEKQRAKVDKLEEERRQRKLKSHKKSSSGGKSAVTNASFVAKELPVAKESFAVKRSLVAQKSFDMKKLFVVKKSILKEPSSAALIDFVYPVILEPKVVFESLRSTVPKSSHLVPKEPMYVSFVESLHKVVMETKRSVVINPLEHALIMEPVKTIVLEPLKSVVSEPIKTVALEASSNTASKVSFNFKPSWYLRFRPNLKHHRLLVGLHLEKHSIIFGVILKLLMILALQIENKWKSIHRNFDCGYKLNCLTKRLFDCLVMMFLLIKHLVLMLDGGECYCHFGSRFCVYISLLL